jgi:hypothetical protein
MHQPWSRYLPLGATLFVVACSCDSSSPFGKATRATSLHAEIRDPAGAVESNVYATLVEVEDDPWPRSLRVGLDDPISGTPSPLAGHIQHIRLLDGALNVVQEIESTPGNSTTNSILTTTVTFSSSENARYEAMRQLFLSGKTTLEVETDLPGQERIRLALPLVGGTGWVTHSCD